MSVSMSTCGTASRPLYGYRDSSSEDCLVLVLIQLRTVTAASSIIEYRRPSCTLHHRGPSRSVSDVGSCEVLCFIA